MNVATVRRIGLYAGPLLAVVCYYFLPPHYSTGPREWVEFSQAGRTTLAMMAWMAAPTPEEVDSTRNGPALSPFA